MRRRAGSRLMNRFTPSRGLRRSDVPRGMRLDLFYARTCGCQMRRAYGMPAKAVWHLEPWAGRCRCTTSNYLEALFAPFEAGTVDRPFVVAPTRTVARWPNCHAVRRLQIHQRRFGPRPPSSPPSPGRRRHRGRRDRRGRRSAAHGQAGERPQSGAGRPGPVGSHADSCSLPSATMA